MVWSRSKITIIAGIITSLDNSYSGQLGVNLQALAGAKAYHVQYCAGTGAWVDAGIWPNTKGIVILNLTPGTVYSVRVRGIGGSDAIRPLERDHVADVHLNYLCCWIRPARNTRTMVTRPTTSTHN